MDRRFTDKCIDSVSIQLKDIDYDQVDESLVLGIILYRHIFNGDTRSIHVETARALVAYFVRRVQAHEMQSRHVIIHFNYSNH